MIVLGVNTGTSADAVDCVACEYVNGRQRLLDAVSLDMPRELQLQIIEAVENAELTVENAQILSHKLTDQYIKVADHLIRKLGPTNHIDVIGLHGQTIHHQPHHQYPYTIQLANAARMADQLSVDVVHDFRTSDISVGGQGAPLIPVYHQYLAEQAGQSSALFINLGGIANITHYSRQTHLKGWDIGPANSLMDLWAQKHLGQPYDNHGQWARSGVLIPELLDRWLQDPYFELTLPKSTGRDYFSGAWLEQAGALNQYRANDVQATLCALTVQAIRSDIVKYVPEKAGAIYVYGKGIYNTFLMEQIQHALPEFIVQTSDAVGVSAQWLESGLFAWLAYCYKQKITCDLRHVTGAKKPVILGTCCLG